MGAESRFQRIEVKYMLTEAQYRTLLHRASEYLQEDGYGLTEICNCYYDTPDYRLIRQSLEKGIYKEKLRLRSYGVPTDRKDRVFLEMKKKYDGIVYKRREEMTLSEAMAFAAGKRSDEDTQVMRELDWMFRYYENLKPRMFLSYKRIAMFERNEADTQMTHTGNEDLRITFDSDILWRKEDVDLRKGIYGEALLPEGTRIMEVKAPGAMPMWLVELLGDMKLYPTSCSKYGKAYEMMVAEEQHRHIA